MSTKTIAVDTRVYHRLNETKRTGESFSKTIDRLLTEVGSAHTGRDILHRLADFEALPEAEAKVFFEVMAENRESERWEERDLR